MIELIKLKIKTKSLAEEARIIKKEENKWLKNIPKGEYPGYGYYSLRNHRTLDVKRETRATLLAIAFLRNKPFNVVERSSKTAPSHGQIKRVATIAYKYRADTPLIKSTENHIRTNEMIYLVFKWFDMSEHCPWDILKELKTKDSWVLNESKIIDRIT